MLFSKASSAPSGTKTTAQTSGYWLLSIRRLWTFSSPQMFVSKSEQKDRFQ